MKNLMKVLAAVIIVMAFSMSAMAQSAVTQGITANATVQTQLVLSQVQTLEFGNVDNVENQTKIISVLGVATSSGSAPGQTGVQQGIGKIVRTGDASVSYTLSSTPTNLDGSSSSVLPIGSYVTAYSFTEGGGQTAGEGTVTDDTVVGGSGTDIYVHIGATVTPSTGTISTGTHTASITLSAEYN